MTATRTPAALEAQLDYYRARAAEYDEWWLRRGRYDRGAELNAEWFGDAAALAEALEAFRPRKRILELACGTGIWTERLLPYASELTALDGSREMLALNEARLKSPAVRYVEADIFEWQPDEAFDTVFFGFWLSHVPPERFAEFWRLVRRCLAPGGRVFFVDSAYEGTSIAVDHRLPPPEATVLKRRLNDGREFEIFKVFYEPEDLVRRLATLGWRFEVGRTRRYFIHGAGRAVATPAERTRWPG